MYEEYSLRRETLVTRLECTIQSFEVYHYLEMYEEYSLRRETLVTRLECTIQSFEWSDRLKSKKDTIQSVYRPKRDALKMKPSVKLSDFLAARTSLLLVEKTSSANVPDRGGRPNEAQPPPPEMPSWQQRSAPGQAPNQPRALPEPSKLSNLRSAPRGLPKQRIRPPGQWGQL
ncbi:Protein FAM98A [Operophtera brumata]|uniref:Protein FAM98A n=1 Tax=Operophtera brumata TaxID=104452 RepID=A0A0L7KQN4_OPEBR|nr:Protein FAM98A [Operophtera brumata]